MRDNNEKIDSPCTGICRIDKVSGYCIGCLRTINEIIAWPSNTIDEKRRILDLIEKRKEDKQNKRR
ncbi:MAG: DUF1289 domain-containing protein [Bacillota bacterium]